MSIKICSKCKKAKDVFEFNIRVASKDGLSPKCRDCCKEYARKYHKLHSDSINAKSNKWKKENPDRVKANSKRYYLLNAKKIHAANAIWRENNPHRIKENRKRYYRLNKNKIIAYNAVWSKQNPDAAKAIRKRYYNLNQEKRYNYYEKNKETIQENRKKWKQRNPDKTAANGANRKAAKLRATPAWVNLKEISIIYKQCAEMNTLTGIKYNVDHIVPLLGKTVCGLHVPWNLQIITATENQKKHAKLIPELVGNAA